MPKNIVEEVDSPLIFDRFPDTDDYLMVTSISDIWKPNGGNTNPYISVGFERIINYDNLSSRLHTSNWDKSFVRFQDKYKNIQISDLPLVTVGSVWKHKKLVQELSSKHFQHNVVSILPLTKSSREIISEPNYLMNQWSKQNAPYLVTDGYILGKRTEIAIPCAELTRFYWGTSTTFFRDLIVYGIDNDLEWFFDKRASNNTYEISEDKKLKVFMNPKYADADAYSFSRIIGNPEARKQARILHRSLQDVASAGKKEAFYLQTGFPFVDGTRLHVYGKFIKLGEIPTFFVLRIMQCYHQFPYKSIEINQVITENIIDNECNNDNFPNYCVKYSNQPIGEIITDSEANKKRHLQKSQREGIPFPAIRQCPLNVKYLRKKATGQSFNVYQPDVDTVSGGDGEYNESIVAPYRNEIKVKHTKQILNDEDQSSKLQIRRIIEPYFDLLIKSVTVLYKGKEISEWNVLEVCQELSIRHSELVLSIFPSKDITSGNVYKWSKMPGRLEPRQCLWIEIKHKNMYLYLCEWERRESDDSAIYLLRKENGIQPTDKDWATIMDLWASDSEYRKVTGLDHLNWFRLSIPHLREEVEGSEEKLAKWIQKRILKFAGSNSVIDLEVNHEN